MHAPESPPQQNSPKREPKWYLPPPSPPSNPQSRPKSLTSTPNQPILQEEPKHAALRPHSRAQRRSHRRVAGPVLRPRPDRRPRGGWRTLALAVVAQTTKAGALLLPPGLRQGWEPQMQLHSRAARTRREQVACTPPPNSPNSGTGLPRLRPKILEAVPKKRPAPILSSPQNSCTVDKPNKTNSLHRKINCANLAESYSQKAHNR